MNYEYYKVFYYVGKNKNITHAAEELYSSQPAVTRTIQNLESELGCRLFVRTKTGVEFTREGQQLYDYIGYACQQLIKAEGEINQTVSPDKGTIYIGTTITALHGFLFDFLDRYHEKYPNVKFKIQTSSSDKTIENLKNGKTDLAFVTTPCNLMKPLEATKILSFQDYLIAGQRFKHLQEKKLKLEDLKEYPLISLVKGMQLRQFVDNLFASHELNVTPDIEADSADLLVPMVEHNWGLAFVPEGFADEKLREGSVFRLKLDTALPKRYVCMVSDPQHPQTAASRELMRMINSEFKK